MTLLVMRPAVTVAAVDTETALEYLESALFNLTHSTGYTRTKRDNPNKFPNTLMGRAEYDLKSAITTLGGTP